LSGAGSVWTNRGPLWVGQFGNGTVTVSDGGKVVADQVIVGDGGQGTVNIGAPAGASAAGPGTLQTSSVTFVNNNGLLVFNHTDTSGSYAFTPTISGPGAVNVYSGTTALTANNTYFGGTVIFGGTLQLGNGGTTGSIIRDVTDNGTFAFNRSDVFTFPGIISGSGGITQLGMY
jgi:autotransporter-associated beta strand protein